jgi:aminopeptidase
MTDERDRTYAELIVDDCLRVEPGWQVLVGGNPQARPLLEELCAAIGRRGAYALLRVSFEGFLPQSLRWVEAVPMEVLAKPAPLFSHELRTADALVFVSAPDNTRSAAALDPARMGTLQAAYRPDTARMMNHDVPWVICQYPTAALAQEAGLSTDAFGELLYGAVLRDWAAEGERMRRVSAHFDAASEIRIVGAGTDLRLSLEGRTMRVDALGANLPGGEFFGCPIEDSAEGEISFGDFPAVYRGREVGGIRLTFAGGVVVDASAEANEEYLLQTLDIDEGARRLGELGIGCNPGITRYMKNTLFDEKMDGTVHLALGNSYTDLGGVNTSAIHWDMVKDLRPPGSHIALDGVVVQQDGAWLVEVRCYAGGGGGTAGGAGAGRSCSMCCHRFSSIRVIGQKVTEPPKSSVPAANTRAPAGVS